MIVDELLSKIGFETDTKPLDKIHESLEGVKRRLEFLNAVELGRGLMEIGHKIFETTHHFAEFAETMGVAANSAGLTVEEMQRLEFAAGQSGVGIEEMSGAMAKLSRSLYEARNGSAEATKAFEDAGIPASQLSSFKTSEDALAALSDRFQGIEDPIKKQALAMSLLGRGSVKMVELMSQGSKSLQEFKDRADAAGAVASGSDIEGLRAFGDAMSGLFQTVRAFSIHLAAQFAPAIQTVVGKLQGFWMANRRIIDSGLQKWLGEAAYGIGFVAGFVRGLIKNFTDLGDILANTFGDKIGKGLAALFGGAAFIALLNPLKTLSILFRGLSGAVTLVARGFGLIATGAWKLATWLFPILAGWFESLIVLMAPFAGTIALCVAAFAALLLAGEAAYTMAFKGGKFEDTWLGKMYKGIKSGANFVLEKLGITDSLPEVSDADAPESLDAIAKRAKRNDKQAAKGGGLFGGFADKFMAPITDMLGHAHGAMDDIRARSASLQGGAQVEDEDLGFEGVPTPGTNLGHVQKTVNNHVNITLQAVKGESVESQMARAGSSLRATLATVSTPEK